MTHQPTLRRRRGLTVVWVIALSVVILGLSSMAVDYGRVQIAKTQLRAAADAGARAGVTALGSVSAVQNLVAQYVTENTCDGTPIAIDVNTDIELLNWDTNTRTYTVLTGTQRNNANAIRVTLDQTISLPLAKLAGVSTCLAHGSSIAAMIPPGYGLVGLNYIKLNGNSSASYWSSTGTVSGGAGNIASNGNITSTSNATIQGTVWTPAGATVTGVTANAKRTLTTPLVYPNGDPSPYNTWFNSNNQLPNGMMSSSSISVGNKSYTVQAGNYVVNNFSVGAGGSLSFLGPATFYVYGSFTMNGQASTNANVPKNLSIVMIPNPSNGTPPGTVTISSGAALYADIYAPQSDITLSGTGAIYGSVVGKSVTMTGSSDIYYDLSTAGGTGVVQVVR